MEEKQENKLIKAFIIKCTAHVKYCYYADKAKTEGFYSVSDAFERVAQSELYQAFALLGQLGYDESTQINLEDAIDGEERDGLSIKKLKEESEAEELFESILNVDADHLDKFKNLLEVIKSEDAYKVKKCILCGKTDKSGKVKSCRFCGYSRFE